jgi:hypothetical protein
VLFGGRRAVNQGWTGASAPGSFDRPTGPEQTFGSPIGQPKRSPRGSSRSIGLGDVDGPVMVNHASTPPAVARAAQTVIATWKPLIILAGS